MPSFGRLIVLARTLKKLLSDLSPRSSQIETLDRSKFDFTCFLSNSLLFELHFDFQLLELRSVDTIAPLNGSARIESHFEMPETEPPVQFQSQPHCGFFS